MDEKTLDASLRNPPGSDALKMAFASQSQLLENYLAKAGSAYDPVFASIVLRESCDIIRRITGAEICSLLLLDREGGIEESFYAHGPEVPVGSLETLVGGLREGLAGWMGARRAVDVVKSIETDDRWGRWPDQPFENGSALCLPIICADRVRGVLFLFHPEPGYFSQETAASMQLAVKQLALIVQNGDLLADLDTSLRKLEESQVSCEAYSQRLDQEMEKGRQLQMDFLPEKLPRLDGWEMQDFFFPANRASGDFYDAFLLREGYLGIVIADVCDKGVGAALFMGLFRSLIRIFSGQARLGSIPVDPAGRTVGGKVEERTGRRRGPVQALRTVALTNDYIAREHGEMGMFATLFFGVLDPADGNLFYVNGGHEPVFVLDQGGIKEELVRTGPAVGLFAETRFGYREIRLAPGDLLFGYTDGVVDACSSTGERFGRNRLVERLSGGGETPGEVVERVATDLFAHIGMAPQEDDITMLALQRKTAGTG